MAVAVAFAVELSKAVDPHILFIVTYLVTTENSSARAVRARGRQFLGLGPGAHDDLRVGRDGPARTLPGIMAGFGVMTPASNMHTRSCQQSGLRALFSWGLQLNSSLCFQGPRIKIQGTQHLKPLNPVMPYYHAKQLELKVEALKSPAQ